LRINRITAAFSDDGDGHDRFVLIFLPFSASGLNRLRGPEFRGLKKI
jgi:hypothetical protein